MMLTIFCFPSPPSLPLPFKIQRPQLKPPLKARPPLRVKPPLRVNSPHSPRRSPSSSFTGTEGRPSSTTTTSTTAPTTTPPWLDMWIRRMLVSGVNICRLPVGVWHEISYSKTCEIMAETNDLFETQGVSC